MNSYLQAAVVSLANVFFDKGKEITVFFSRSSYCYCQGNCFKFFIFVLLVCQIELMICEVRTDRILSRLMGENLRFYVAND